jgi:hypothetical protein
MEAHQWPNVRPLATRFLRDFGVTAAGGIGQLPNARRLPRAVDAFNAARLHGPFTIEQWRAPHEKEKRKCRKPKRSRNSLQESDHGRFPLAVILTQPFGRSAFTPTAVYLQRLRPVKSCQFCDEDAREKYAALPQCPPFCGERSAQKLFAVTPARRISPACRQ